MLKRAWARVGQHTPRPLILGLVAVIAVLIVGGCRRRPTLLPADQQKQLDRKIVEYPAGTALTPYLTGLTAPTAIAFDHEGSLLIAEGGIGEHTPRIFGFRKDGTYFDIYPRNQQLPFTRQYLHGPIGGMTAAMGRIYVTHRDDRGRGVVTAFNYDGTHQTIAADLPAQGDHSVTDIAVSPEGRVYFGVGTATNSGVVGLDNTRWMREDRAVCDRPWTRDPQSPLTLLGYHFQTPNPFAGLFGGSDLAVTAPFQPFGKSIESRIERPRNGKPGGAIYSVSASGGDLKVESYGIRYPVGLRFNEYGRLLMTNQGMKLRGTRPVKDDPDVLLKMVYDQWYGWPDFSANLLPIRESRFQPPMEMIVKSGYRELSSLIDHENSRLSPPSPRQANLLAAEFPPLSGAAKFDFVPSSGPLSKLRQGRNLAIVALNGDRAPFDSGGLKLKGPVGFMVVSADVDKGQVEHFIRNAEEGPRSRRGANAAGLERPIDVKFGPDGAMYILDFGRMEVRGGREHVANGSGRIYKLIGAAEKPNELP